jgi:hypothetical protein
MSAKRSRNKGRRLRQSATAAGDPKAKQHPSNAHSAVSQRLSYAVKSLVTPVPPGMVRYYCNCCDTFEDIPQAAIAEREASREASREKAQMREDWERWVREHGVEGAEIIADCMD